MRQQSQQRTNAKDEAVAFRTAAAGMQRTADAMTEFAALLERIAAAEDAGDAPAPCQHLPGAGDSSSGSPRSSRSARSAKSWGNLGSKI